MDIFFVLCAWLGQVVLGSILVGIIIGIIWWIADVNRVRKHFVHIYSFSELIRRVEALEKKGKKNNHGGRL